MNNNTKKIEYELMRLIASDSYASSFALLVIISVITSLFWNLADKTILFFLVFSIFVTITARIIFIKQFLQLKLTLQFNKITLIYNLVTILSAIFTSLLFFFLLPNKEPLYQVFLTMVVSGLSAGAVMTLSYHKNLIRVYLIILLIPFIYAIYSQNSDITTALALLVFLFLLTLIIFSTKYNKNIVNNLRTKYLALETQKELQVSEKNFSSIFREVPIGLFTYNHDFIITHANKALSALLQAPINKLIGLDMKNIEDQEVIKHFYKVFENQKGHYEGKYHTYIKKLTIWVKLNAIPLYDSEGNIIAGLGIVEDITQQTKHQEQLKYQAFYDSLTGLGNRDLLIQHLKQLLSKLKRSNEHGVLLFIDLDNFKNINDSLGHNIGDEILKIFSKRIKGLLRETDIVARFGGDEFVVLISETNLDLLHTEAMALTIANKIHDTINKPVEIENSTLFITISLGVKILYPYETDTNKILKYADIAMYQSKNSGKDKTSFFDSKMSQQMQEQLTLNNELKIAIEKRQFELYLQPVVNLKTDKIVSAEALIRWNHPTIGVVYPDKFIDFAEKSNLIIEIGNWVIDRAFAMHKELSDKIEDIAINISLKQFYQNNFIEILLKSAQKYNVNPSFIKLELTESITLKDLDETIDKMLILKSHGFRFAMDDFGTGYSSLSYLKNLPFDYLKIDQSFVINMLKSNNDKKLIKIIIDVSKQFNFLIIAEGVETYEHVKFMKENGCDFYQGYFTSKPVPLEEFKKLLQ